MKLHELASAPGNNMKRLVMLKLMLQRGHPVEIADAAYSQGHFAWGDLEELGFAEKRHQRKGKDMLEWWTYTGPSPIILITTTSTYAGGNVRQEETPVTMNPGDSTDPVQIDIT